MCTGRGRRFRDNLQTRTLGILQGEGFGKLLQNQRPIYRVPFIVAQTEHLPIYKAAYDLCLYLEQIVRNFCLWGDEGREGSHF